MTDWKFIEVAGITTRYRESGRGEPIVLIHGGEFGSGSADAWPDDFIEGLACDYRVMAFDRLGNGHTDNPSEDSGFRMSAVTEHAANFMTELGVERATVVGQSRGAYVAARVAKTHPYMVKNLVLINSGSISVRFPAEPMPSMPSYKIYYELATGDIRHDSQLMSVTHEHITDEWVTAREAAMLSEKARAAKAAMERERDAFFEEFEATKAETMKWLIGGGLTKPTLIIWGVGDRTTTLRDGVDIFEILQPHVDRLAMHIMNRSGHWPHREYPVETATQISDFLKFDGNRCP